jgi:hypothetical protein
MQKDKLKQNKIKTALEDMLIYNRIRPHGHILKMTEERVLKKLVNRELKERCPRGHQDRSGENRLVKLSHRKMEGRTWEETDSKIETV